MAHGVLQSVVLFEFMVLSYFLQAVWSTPPANERKLNDAFRVGFLQVPVPPKSYVR